VCACVCVCVRVFVCVCAVSFVFGGLHVGSIVGLLAAPALIHASGWQSLFVVFGAAGLVWWAWYESLISQIADTDPEFACKLSMESDEASHGTALSRYVRHTWASMYYYQHMVGA
jgi:MFS family permease